MKGLLEKTNVLIIGPMEEDLETGAKTRAYAKESLAKLNINVWDHYSRPFLNEFSEDEKSHQKMIDLRENEEFEKLSDLRNIRRQDLALVDTADIIICVFDKKTFSVGTFNELFLADFLRKPIFFVWGEGKKKCPFWIFWTIPHNYIYNSLDEALETIKKINNGEKKIDSKRWRLKKYEYR
jgi:hypothetical protein